jgi:DNA-binding NtrC family response regulator
MGKFRNDLFYRINVFPIHLPPLQDHRDDIGLLSKYFNHKFSRAFGSKPPRLADSALLRLKSHCWPGNVRELKNVIGRAMILCKSDCIGTRHLVLHESPEAHVEKMGMDEVIAFLMGTKGIDLEDLENRFVHHAMQMARQKVSKAARLLGMTRPTLRCRLEKLGYNAGNECMKTHFN